MPELWRHAALSLAGEHHTRVGQRCGDASAAVWDADLQTLLLVAADGAGEAERAAEGSEIAVAAIQHDAAVLLHRDPTALDDADRLDELIVGLARGARERLEVESSGTDGSNVRSEGRHGMNDTDPLSAYATTLLVVIVTPQRLAAVQVGDGYILRATSPTDVQALFRPSRGRYANETCFLTSYSSFDELVAQGQVQAVVLPVRDTVGIALITDGLEHVAMDMRAGGVPHPPFFMSLMRELFRHEPVAFVQRLGRYLAESPKVKERSDDDKTLILAVDVRKMPAVLAALEGAAAAVPSVVAASSEGEQGSARSDR